MRAGDDQKTGADGVWQDLSAGLTAGIHHSLNNRLGALGAVAQLLESDLDDENPLRGALRMEIERLQQTVEILALLPRNPVPTEQPLLPQELLDGALQLYRLHHDLRDVPCTVETTSAEPVLGDPARLVHLLVSAAAAAAIRAARLEGGAVHLRAYTAGDRIALEVEAHESEPLFEGLKPFEPQITIDEEKLTAWANEEGVELEVSEDRSGAASLTMWLPSLRAARREKA